MPRVEVVCEGRTSGLLGFECDLVFVELFGLLLGLFVVDRVRAGCGHSVSSCSRRGNFSARWWVEERGVPPCPEGMVAVFRFGFVRGVELSKG